MTEMLQARMDLVGIGCLPVAPVIKKAVRRKKRRRLYYEAKKPKPKKRKAKRRAAKPRIRNKASDRLAGIQWQVYGLIDPCTGVIRYVGISKHLRFRMLNHFEKDTDSHNPKSEWIRSLKSVGLLPIVAVLEDGQGEGAAAAESRWIAYFREMRIPLTNAMSGGYSLSEGQRQKRGPAQGKPKPIEDDDIYGGQAVTLFDLIRELGELLVRAKRRAPPSPQATWAVNGIIKAPSPHLVSLKSSGSLSSDLDLHRESIAPYRENSERPVATEENQ